MAFRSLFNSIFTHALVHSADEEAQQSNYQNKQCQKSDNVSLQVQHNAAQSFQMPLNYPRYTKADYENMEEWKVDMLLRQYGLDHHIQGKLHEKIKFAIGTFLWPDQQ